MELRQLSYFTTIVNEGNISQAAKKLNISQPPLSHQMKLLEAELGVTLFERGSRRIRLTPAGKTFSRPGACDPRSEPGCPHGADCTETGDSGRCAPWHHLLRRRICDPALSCPIPAILSQSPV
ncbi:MAG: LysR family transcriptional regulator [Clostridium fessum]